MDDINMEVDDLSTTEVIPSMGPASRYQLPPKQLETLKAQLRRKSEEEDWVSRLQKALSGSSAMWRGLCFSVLSALTHRLDVTDLKGIVLTNLQSEHIDRLVDGCTEMERDSMRDRVQKGIIENDWAALIRHPQLRQMTPSTSGNLHQPKEESPLQQAQRLDQMFHQAYQGKAADDFRLGLNVYRKIYNHTTHFGRCISVLQSSGTGKSRLVEELGNLVPTLSVCLRKDSSPRAGWPPGDIPVVRFFKNNDYLGEELAAAFLGAMMGTVADMLESQAPSNTSQPVASWNKGFLKGWRLDKPIDVANSSRYGCFTKVETLAFENLKSGEMAIEAMRLPSERPEDYSRSVADWHNDLFEFFCVDSYSRLVKVLQGLRQEYFVFAFDECTQLGNPLPMLKDRRAQMGMTLIALQRIIKSFDAFSRAKDVTEKSFDASSRAKDVTVWFLLLDTTSSIPDLLPHGPDAHSIRLTEGYVPLPPWPYIGFNQVVPKDHILSFRKPSDALNLKHIKVYGRPIWKLFSDNEVLKLAVEKLFSGPTFDPKNANHVFAAFATRIGLEIGEGEASARLAIDAVRSYMRILIGISGRVIITDSPSEPMLALAAAAMLNLTPKAYREALTTLLDELILRGLILDRGLLGELFCRLLLMLARDKAVLPHGGDFVSTYGNQHTIPPAKLSEFFQTLLGQNLGIPDSEIEQSKLRNTFLREMSNVWINFTHFVQLSEPVSEVTPFMLRAAWSAGYAFQCAFNQPVIDGFLVAYRGDLDKPFDSTNLFLLPWQSKARSEAAELALAQQLTAPFVVGDNLVRCKPKHVVLLMDLGASSAFGHARGPHCQMSYGEAKRPAAKSEDKNSKGGKWDGYARDGEKEAKRYCLNIRGHSPQEYPVITDFKEQFNQLFQRSLTCTRVEYDVFQDDFLHAINTLNIGG